MGLHHADDFLERFKDTYKVFITGELGTGKTLTSFMLADYFLREQWVDGVWANIGHRFPRADRLNRAFVIVDETADSADSRDFKNNQHALYSRYARKMNCWYAFPSVDAIDIRLRNLEVIRTMNVQVLPMTIWVYRWYYAMGGQGWFAVTNPEDYFGLYETGAVPIGDGGVTEAICAEFPEAIYEIINSRNKYKKLVDLFKGFVEDKRVSYGGRPVTSAVELDPILAEFRQRIEALEARVEELSGLASGATGIAGESESISKSGFRY